VHHPHFTFETWRNTARPWLAAGHKADEIRWHGTASELTERAARPDAASTSPTRSELRLPRPLMSLLQNLACFRHDSRWELMYRLTWRVLYENPHLLADPADPDIANALSMDRAVRRDIHKMHAFVRFREIRAGDRCNLSHLNLQATGPRKTRRKFSGVRTITPSATSRGSIPRPCNAKCRSTIGETCRKPRRSRDS